MTTVRGTEDTSLADLDQVIQSTLDENEMEYDKVEPGNYVVSLPGTRRLKTNCRLFVGEHSLRVEAFVMRHPDENRERLWEYLLLQNAKMYVVSWTVDPVGDVYLMGRLPLSAVSEDEIDRVLGAVLSYADDHFNTMLEIGFGASIRREWEWRVSRGESLANLQAFAAFADPNRRNRNGS